MTDLLRLICLLVVLVRFCAATAKAGDVVMDPIADYLAMNVPDRATNAGRLLILKRVEVDLNGDGRREVFVGTWYRNSGPNTWLWVGYMPVARGYQRITPAGSDVLIDFDGIYIGALPDLHRQGMAQAYSLELDNKDREQSNMISDLTFYYLENGKLVEEGSGILDRDDPEQKAKFDFYFGPNRKTRDSPKIESFTVQELAQRGYKIPLWRKVNF